MKSQSQFLNVDLEIESTSKSKLKSLSAEFGEKVFVLYFGAFRTRRQYMLSIVSARQPGNPDAAIHALCSIIERLSVAGKRRWDSAVRREFDIGYESHSSQRLTHFSLRTDTLRRVANLGATIAVTFYRREVDEAKRKCDKT